MNAENAEIEAVALTGRAADPRVAEALRLLAEHLLRSGKNVRVIDGEELDIGLSGITRSAEAELVDGAGLIVAVGGDGTMLHAARLAAGTGVPLLGVNRGRLGFLADVSPEKMLDSVDDALAGRCIAEHRMLLRAIVPRSTGTVSEIALNDVVVSKYATGRTLGLQTWVDGNYVNTHGGDGFIVSTSTGSTAYALSCGGPIVHPSIHAVVLVPICPHTLSDRPIVVGADSVIEIELAERFDTAAQVICDGIVLCDLDPGVRLKVARAEVTATLLHPPGHDYFRILRSKLHWGRGGTMKRRAED
jgi:NAD+ kinase